MSPIPLYIRRKAYARTHGRCAICGKPVSRNERQWSVEHFLPRAIYKWVPGKRIHDLIESSDNIFIVHRECNVDKGSDLPTKQMIENFGADAKTKRRMQRLRQEAQADIDAYRAMKQSVLERQGRRCAGCGRPISFGDATMRRIDSDGERTKENAMCLCERCNRKTTGGSRRDGMAERAERLRRKAKAKARRKTRDRKPEERGDAASATKAGKPRRDGHAGRQAQTGQGKRRKPTRQRQKARNGEQQPQGRTQGNRERPQAHGRRRRGGRARTQPKAKA